MSKFKILNLMRPKIDMIVLAVDAHPIRNINPDFDIIEWRNEKSQAPICDIPNNEKWIDSLFWDERASLIQLATIEIACRKVYGNQFSHAKFREKIKRELTWDGPKPTVSDMTVRTENQDGFLIRYVDGEIIRQWIDPWYSFGGHELVYDYVPTGEIWIDEKQHPLDKPHTIDHEIYERHLMSLGFAYNDAHKMATKREKAARVRELTLGGNKYVY